jgi:hypothetical protein
MFKLIITVKRRAGLSLDEFETYYKTKHLPLLGSILPNAGPRAKAIRLNIVKRDDPFLKSIGDDRADSNPPFDCVTEAEFDCREHAEHALGAFFEPANLARIKQDERAFCDLRSIRFYVVEAGD